MPDRVRDFIHDVVQLEEFRPEAVASLLGATLRCETDTGYRAAHTLALPEGSPFTVGAVASSRKSGWLCITLDLHDAHAPSLADLEGLLLDRPHVMEPRHVSLASGPAIVGIDHHFAVPVGQLTLRVSRSHRALAAGELRRLHEDDINGTSDPGERVEEILITNEPSPALASAPTLRALREWGRGRA